MMKTLIFALTMSAILVSEPPVDDPPKKFIDQMDKAPPEKRVPNWEQTKTLMARIAPNVGETAPDFSLAILESDSVVRLSQHRDDRPVVLVFGSFT